MVDEPRQPRFFGARHARQSLVATRLDRATNMVTLYEALGGGLKP